MSPTVARHRQSNPIASVRVTETGGRNASTRQIAPKLALAVGMPSISAPDGWRWSALTDLARLESGHTPSRRHPEYWGGDIPWIGIQDARANDGRRIETTNEYATDLGIANSSARSLPTNTVCLSRTASVGYVVVMGRSMATSQDFVNWVCSKHLDHDFLKYVFLAEGEDLLRFASGSVHQTIYFPEAKAFHICHPPVQEQRRIVGLLDNAFDGIAAVKSNTEKHLHGAHALIESHSHAVFADRSAAWTARKLPLAGLCELIVDCEHKTAPRQEDGIPSIRTPNIGKGKLLLDDVYRVSEETYHEWTRRAEPRAGDLILAREAPAGNVAVIPPGLRLCLGQRTVLVRPDADVFDSSFLALLLLQPNMQNELLAHSRGATVQHVNMKDIRALDVGVIPSVPTQRGVVGRIQQMSLECEKLILACRRKLAALDALKKSLLHHAFTGQL
jgi:type I restriction enzyme S subunit